MQKIESRTTRGARRLAASAVLALAAVAGLVAPNASAAPVAQPTLVSTVPDAYTPNVTDGVVLSIAQTGSTVVLGGTFTSIAPHGSSTTTPAPGVAAFTAGVGALVPTFTPTVSGGTVDTVIEGPIPGTVYIAGTFKTVDGVATRVALLDASTGALVPGWKPVTANGEIWRLVLAGGQLFAGGGFGKLGGQTRNGLGTLDPSTGAVTGYSTLAFTGHHNYGVNCTPGVNCVQGAVGVKAMAVSPDGSKMVALGNFTDVSGSSRDQAVMLDLDPTGLSVDQDWNTDAFTGACSAQSFDSYVRDVQFSPDGSYFAVTSTGGAGTTAQNTNVDGTRPICDGVGRFESADTGSDVQPTWVDWTGRDTLWTLAITGPAIYVGGHERWLNNSKGPNNAAEGAVPRPGLAAVDPENGMPLSWNPGRNPRGEGAYALLATADGLYVGSDTDWIGDFHYQRKKVAFFPLAGGGTLQPNTVGALPGTVYRFGPAGAPGSVLASSWNGPGNRLSPGPVVTGLDPTASGVFYVGGYLYYWANTGTDNTAAACSTTNPCLYRAPFDGFTVGTPQLLDPYHDPLWDNSQTGSGQTYLGVVPSFYGELPKVTSDFFSGGRLYYTLSSSSKLFYRYFETDDGVLSSQELTTTDANNWSHVAGAFLSGGTLYFADSSTHALMQIPFVEGQPSGTPTVADSAINWSSQSDLVLSFQIPPVNEPPTAAFTASCTYLSCAVDGTSSSDPDGTVASYAWDFGDGATSTDPAPSHTYGAAGTYTVRLTVTDDDGATGSTTQNLTVAPAPQPISFVGAASQDGSGTSQTVTVPASVQPGDTLLLFESHASTTTTATPPPGWTQVATTSKNNLTSTLYERAATYSDAGGAVPVGFSAPVKAAVTIAAYHNVAAGPLQAVQLTTATTTASHATPALSALTDGSWVVTFWTDKSTTTSQWTPPGGVTDRSESYGSGGGAVSALLADTAGAVSGGYPSQTATTNVTSGSAAQYAIALSAAPTTS